jgi:hypothetical protein
MIARYGDGYAKCWIVAGAVLLTGCNEVACPASDTVTMPSGEFSPANSGRWVEKENGEDVEDAEDAVPERFPHGAIGGDEIEDARLPPGEPILSARLSIDREDGIVIRTYVDDDGRTVEERWRFREEATP